MTVPQTFGLDTWLSEGDPAGTRWSGKEWHFYLSYLSGPVPDIQPHERVYVTYGGALRGYAPLVRIDRSPKRYGLVRHGGAVACTIPEYIQGFQGWRPRWWSREQECDFPDWQNPDAIFASKIHPVTLAGCTSTFLWSEREVEKKRALVMRVATIQTYTFAFFGLAPLLPKRHVSYSEWYWVAFRDQTCVSSPSPITLFAQHYKDHAWDGEIARSGETSKGPRCPSYRTLLDATRSALRWVNAQALRQ